MTCRTIITGPGDVARFWAKVDRRGPDDCWPWNGSLKHKGYGQFWIRGSGMVGAHRVAYLISSSIQPGPEVMHTCDNRACCNPSHLRDGTHADNMADMVAKGRQARGESLGATLRGEKNGAALLTEADVVTIRRRRKAGDSAALLSREFGVSVPTIVCASLGKNWRHVGEPPPKKMTHREAQIVGARSKTARVIETTIPKVVAELRARRARGEKMTQRACAASIPGYGSALNYLTHFELLSRARG